MAKTKDNTLIDTSVRSAMYRAGRKAKITKIVIHHWGSLGQKHSNVVSYLSKKRTNGPTSAHYVVSAGRINEIVDPKNTAWHARNGNSYTIGIECRPEMSDGDFETVAQLVAYLRSIYGNLPLVGHKDIVSTDCPGKWYGKLSALSNRANEINKGSVKPSTPATTTTTNKITVDGRFGKETAREMQKRLNVSVDGKIGPSTIKAWQKHEGTPVDGFISGQNEFCRSHCPAISKEYMKLGNGGSTLIKVLQRNLNLQQDGLLGPNTIKALQNALNNNPNALK